VGHVSLCDSQGRDEVEVFRVCRGAAGPVVGARQRHRVVDHHRLGVRDPRLRVDPDRHTRSDQRLDTTCSRARRGLVGDQPDIDGSFVVLNASRLDKRKRVDLTVRGFARFAAGKPPNVRLCLHHAIMDDASERDLRSWIQQCGLTERVFLNPLGSRIVADDELNLLYNASDVGINTSMGEGWGLVSCEHGAAGAAQIVPDHTACAELWRGRAELIPPARTYIPDFSVLEMGEVSEEGVARALEVLYREPSRRQELSRAAVAVAHNPAHSWDVITGQFDRLFMALGRT